MKFKVTLDKLEGVFSIACDVMWSKFDFTINIALFFWQLSFIWWRE